MYVWRQLGAGLLTLSLLLSGCTSKVDEPTVTKAQGLTIQSWPVSAKPGDPAYKIPDEARAAVEGLQPPPTPAIAWEETQWAKLRRWGYELEAVPSGGYKVTQNGLRLSEATILPYAIAFSESDKRFALVLGGNELLTEQGKQAWNQFRHLDKAPFFIGESMYWVQTKNEQADGFQVVREGEVLYEGALDNRRASIGLERFQRWESHWVVETVESRVIIDGKSLNDSEGYNQVFFWRPFQGKPIYLYKKNGKYGINWDGKDLGLAYDQIFHGGCCDNYDFNPLLIKEGQGITLHVKQGDTWHYVLITKNQ